MKKIVTILLFGFIIGMALVGCSEDTPDRDDRESTSTNTTGIPSDALAGENPVIDVPNTSIPNMNYSIERSGNYVIVRLDLTGIQDPETRDWLELIGTGNKEQNVWVSVDDTPKGILVYNNGDEGKEQNIKADLVFLVDNSGSMSEEANLVASEISSWATKLAESGLDIRFGCVGYNDAGRISGALDFSSAEKINEYLNRPGISGTSRTTGFYGDKAEFLSNSRTGFNDVWGECGVVALTFADSLFSFRVGANRIYVNFTDEPNQPYNYEKWSVEKVKDVAKWPVSKGTIHTVYSEDTTCFRETPLSNEKPWRLSEYTGGTILQTPYNFSGVSLESLPVTGAMQNSYIIRFTNVDKLMDGKNHVVKITVFTLDGSVKAEKTFTINFGALEE